MLKFNLTVGFLILYFCAAAQDTCDSWVLIPSQDSIGEKQLNENYFRIKIGNKTGIYNKWGNFSIPPVFETITNIVISQGLEGVFAIGKQNGKAGVYSSKRNKMIVPCKYDHITLREPVDEENDIQNCHEPNFNLTSGNNSYVYNHKSGKTFKAEEYLETEELLGNSMEEGDDNAYEPSVVAEVDDRHPQWNDLNKDPVYKRNEYMLDSFFKAANLKPIAIFPKIQCLGYNTKMECRNRNMEPSLRIFKLGHTNANSVTRYVVFNGSTRRFITPISYTEPQKWNQYIVVRWIDNLTFYDTLGNRVYSLEVPKYFGITSEHIIFTNKKGKYGLVDKNLTTVLKPKFDDLSFVFNTSGIFENYLITKRKKKQSLFDLKTNGLLPVSADSIYALKYGICILQKKNKYYFYNLQNRKVLEPTLDSIALLKGHDKYAYVWRNGNVRLFDKEKGLSISKEFKTIINKRDTFQRGKRPYYSRFRAGQEAEDSIFYVQNIDGKTGVLDYNGTEIIPCKYDRIKATMYIYRAKSIEHPIQYFLCYNGNFGSFYSVFHKRFLCDSIIQVLNRESNTPALFIPTRTPQGWQLICLDSGVVLNTNAQTISYKDRAGYGGFTFQKNNKYFYYNPLTNIHFVAKNIHYYSKMNVATDYVIYSEKDTSYLYNRYTAKFLTSVPCDTIWESSWAAAKLYGYFYLRNNKFGILNIKTTNKTVETTNLEPAIFQGLRCGTNNLLWAKNKNKWGVLRTDGSVQTEDD